jgi:hypothetical protein
MTTVPVFLAAERSLFVVLGSDHDPVLTWDRDFEVALDFARIHNGLVVAVPVLADYTAAGPAPESTGAVYECPQCGPTRQTGEEHAETHHTIRYLRSEPDVFDLPHRGPVAPVVPSATGSERPHIGWAMGGRAAEPAAGWDFERVREEEAAEIEAAEVVDLARQLVPGTPAQVIVDAYEALGVKIAPAAAEAIAHSQRKPPELETLQRIRDGLSATGESVREPWVYPACSHRPDAGRVLYSPCGECVLLDAPTIDMSRKAALPPE